MAEEESVGALRSTDFAPLPVEGERVLVLAFDPELPCGGLEAAEEVLVVLPPRSRSSSRQTPSSLSSSPSSRPSSRLSRLRAFRPTLGVLSTLRGARPGPILAASLAGVRRFLVVDWPGSAYEVNLRGALALASSRSARRASSRLMGRVPPPWPSLASSLQAASQLADRPCPQASADANAWTAPQSIVHFLPALGAGGAERQLCYLAKASVRAGHEVRVLTYSPLSGPTGHYVASLRLAGVRVEQLPPGSPGPEALAGLGLPEPLVRALTEHVAAPTLLALVARLRQLRPQVLHAWLDQANAIGALAGLAAGVPRIALGARNLSPEHLPRLREPWFRATYHALARNPRVALIANSRAGAADYAAWSETPPERWRVIHNGFDLSDCQPLSEEERAESRRKWGVPLEAPLVVGVFRLSAEKRPLDFLLTLDRLRSELPELRAIHVGDGPDAARLRSEAEELGLLDGTLRFAGRQSRPWAILGAADASLLTSQVEGLPNVALESQALQVPIVLTRSGGSPEAIDPGATGFVCDVGDVEALAQQLAVLLGDRAKARSMGRAGPSWIRERFSMQRMVEATQSAYLSAAFSSSSS